MKKFVILVVMLILCLGMTACGSDGGEEQSDLTPEIALISRCADIENDMYNKEIWDTIQSVSSNAVGCQYYLVDAKDEDKYMTTVEEAIDAGGKLIIFADNSFANTAYEAQKKFEDINFYIIDSVPHDSKNNYKLQDNSIGVLFAEEQAGYLAGYAAVVEGYRNVGFIGGEEEPSVKRYGYGFVQGISQAVADNGVKKDINIKYTYSGTFDVSDEVRDMAASWYKDGCEVIFACGGAMNTSVIEAAEKNQGLVIGVDVDQSGESETVITSAKKALATPVEDVVKQYKRGEFPGNNVFTYSASNDGIGLEMDNSKLTKFDESQYNQLYKKLKNGKIKVLKDTEVKSIKDLAGKKIIIDNLK